MTEFKGTRGLWRLYEASDARPHDVFLRPELGSVRIQHYGYIDPDGSLSAEMLANARLISAAPELLEALDPETLEAIADEIDGFEHSARAASLRGIAKRQRAAIAKALGEGQ